ncbi:MAG: hypothetical protein RI909_1364, partial [Bacteroidota bacterium]
MRFILIINFYSFHHSILPMKKLLLLLCLASGSLFAQSTDDYTRYELLDPYTNNFRILYEVSATTPDALVYHNTLRKGSGHFVDRVVDLQSGKLLTWSIVHGEEAKRNGLASADNDTDYLQVNLDHPVAKNSKYRLLIDKTYNDPQSYYAQEDRIVFHRSLDIKRNSIVLPKGYELIACNYPAQVMIETDGRVKISFINRGSEAVPLHIEGRKLLHPIVAAPLIAKDNTTQAQGRDKSKARVGLTLTERAHQTREIVYYLQQPETHSFRLYHDYTETKEGVNKYVNIVRAGSKASNPSAYNLDNGKPLKVETLVGQAIKDKGIDIGADYSPTAEAIVIWFDAVKKGTTTRIRIEETYTDPNRYLISNNELVWDRSFGRVYNTITLPEGWWLTANAVPATVFL